jgi:Fic family protein
MNKVKKNQRIGSYIKSTIAGESINAYLPPSLPPTPPINLESMQGLMEKANLALGRLDGLANMLPDVSLFLYYYVRKEAVLSSQIEGTQSSLSDLLLFETKEKPGVLLEDVQEVSNYVAAMTHGLKRIREGFPISLRLLKEVHHVLLSQGRGSSKSPGEFRSSQNWIGGTRPGNAFFVPPPPDRLMESLSNLEHYLHNNTVPTLVKAAVSHVQFETIHPFLDGNGRLGRLLITLLLCSEGILSEPLLYLSLYFKSNRQNYYDLLQRVRMEGDWESWLSFFFNGVLQTSELAVSSSRKVFTVFEEDEQKLIPESHSSPYARSQTHTLLSMLNVLKKNPIIGIKKAADLAGLSYPTAGRALGILEAYGIAKEITRKKRGQLFVYEQYLKILQEGTEVLPL